jgi:hypothetical protein
LGLGAFGFIQDSYALVFILGVALIGILSAIHNLIFALYWAGGDKWLSNVRPLFLRKFYMWLLNRYPVR